MNKENLIKAISKSQDNDVLVKGFADDDFLSRFLINTINGQTTLETGEVDLGGVSNDLGYAIDQLEKALKVVNSKWGK
jgi:hypothetical protein